MASINLQGNGAYRVALPTGTNLNDVAIPGVYNLDSSNSYTNAPDTYGYLEVVKSDLNATRILQHFANLNGNWVRFKAYDTWSSWVNTEPVKVTGTISGSTTTLTKSSITSTMEVIGYSLGTPSSITSSIGWTTANGSITLTTTVALGESSTITLYLSECL